MRFVPRLSIGARLLFAMVLVVVVSWLLGGMLVFRLTELGVLQPGPPRRPLPAFSGVPGASEEVPPPAPGTGEAQPDTSNLPPAPPSGEGPRGGGPPPLWRNPILVIHLAVSVLVAMIAGIWLAQPTLHSSLGQAH